MFGFEIKYGAEFITLVDKNIILVDKKEQKKNIYIYFIIISK